MIAVALLLICGAWLVGQQTGPSTRPAENPTTRPSSVLEQVKDGTTQPAAPEAQYREGTFLVDQLGKLSHDKKGEPIFVFDKGSKKVQVTLMADSNLQRMEDAAGGAEKFFRITGMLTEYRGKNYLLVDRVVMASKEPSEEQRSPK